MKCCYCGVDLTAANQAVAMREPAAPDSPENRRVCCLSCKLEKGGRSDLQWKADKKREALER